MIRNEKCPKCTHHMMEHVLVGSHGNGCQVLVGESEPSSCNCDFYDYELCLEILHKGNTELGNTTYPQQEVPF